MNIYIHRMLDLAFRYICFFIYVIMSGRWRLQTVRYQSWLSHLDIAFKWTDRSKEIYRDVCQTIL